MSQVTKITCSGMGEKLVLRCSIKFRKSVVSTRRDFSERESDPKNLSVKAERLETAEHVPAIITLSF